jgi:hypothetical protein
MPGAFVATNRFCKKSPEGGQSKTAGREFVCKTSLPRIRGFANCREVFMPGIPPGPGYGNIA